MERDTDVQEYNGVPQAISSSFTPTERARRDNQNRERAGGAGIIVTRAPGGITRQAMMNFPTGRWNDAPHLLPSKPVRRCFDL
jgi:hypothetical protein